MDVSRFFTFATLAMLLYVVSNLRMQMLWMVRSVSSFHESHGKKDGNLVDRTEP